LVGSQPGGRVVVAGVQGGAAHAQRVRLRRPAVVGERTQHRVAGQERRRKVAGVEPLDQSDDGVVEGVFALPPVDREVVDRVGAVGAVCKYTVTQYEGGRHFVRLVGGDPVSTVTQRVNGSAVGQPGLGRVRTAGARAD